MTVNFDPMTWKNKLVIRILLLIAYMIAEGEPLKTDIRNLANHIMVNG